MKELIPQEVVERRILVIREQFENWKSQIATSNRDKFEIIKQLTSPLLPPPKPKGQLGFGRPSD